MSTNNWYTASGTPPMIGRVLDPETWRRYVEDYDFGAVRPNKVVLHHTWSPNQYTWNGLTSMKGMQTYYRDVKGWTSAPHIYVAGDGIWLFTPMKDVGIHAGACNETRNPQGRLIGYSIGVEMVWDGSKNLPSGPTWDLTLWVLGELSVRLNIEPWDLITFHRDCGKPSCPGSFVPSGWVYAEVEKWLGRHHGKGLAAYYVMARVIGEETSKVYQGPATTFPEVRSLTLGEQILSDEQMGDWVHMARFPPLQYDEGFILEEKLSRAF